MREASNRRTVTDTDSYAFFVKRQTPMRGRLRLHEIPVSKYRVTFTYGSWQLWADIERPKIDDNDRRSFADLAQFAVSVALDSMPSIERKHVAHDYVIFELTRQISGEATDSHVYVFDTLANE